MDCFFKKQKIISKPLPAQLNCNKRAEKKILVPKQNFGKTFNKRAPIQKESIVL